MLKLSLAIIALAAVPATTASAITLLNKDGKEHTIGLDPGSNESVHKIPAGKSMSFKEQCPTGCGVTGPWGYSVLLKPGETWEFDGKPIAQTEPTSG